MSDQGAREDRRVLRERLLQGCDGLATLLEVGAASSEFLLNGNGLAAKAARLVALGLRVVARWARVNR